MMVFKKKEVIAAALVVLIGMAGYLNWSYQDTVQVRDGDSYIETGKKLGEAQYVSTVEEVEEQNSETAEETASDEAQENEQVQPTAETVQQEGSEDYFEQARLDKEKSRSKSLEILNETAANESFDEEIRKKAGDKIILQAQNIEREAQIESIAQSKGYNEICVYIDEDRVNISVRKDGFSDADAVKLTEIATDNLKISSKNIKIVEVK
ncbi:MAG: SpoIIIAH-like family protein [Clostridia bacterium]|nr:SpoIIIAH-like family protein [Clostridia bacterium]